MRALRRLALAALVVGGAPSVRAAPDLTQQAHIPELFDPNLRLQKPDAGTIKSIRFLTTDDFPPFHFALADGSLAGFDIDLARMICADLKITCTIQARRFATLTKAIKDREADVLIAAVANTPATRETLAFTAPYYTTPGRFVAKTRPGGEDEPGTTPAMLAGQVIGVEAGTAHEAFLHAFFARAIVKTFKDQQTLRDALMGGSVEVAFGDAIALSLWLNGSSAKACCRFVGGPYTESRYFGAGVSLALAKDDPTLRQALDYELSTIGKSGAYADLYLKYFPIGFY